MNKENNLRSGMIIVLVTNIINMVLNIALNFIQPKILPVDTYAAIKTFTLYMSCVGIFHLGYEDGMYLKYGGCEISEVDRNGLSGSISTLRIFQLAVSIGIFIVGILKSDQLLACFGLLILPYNMMMYFRLLYQATGNFDLYGKILNFTTCLLFLGNFFLMFVLKKSTFMPYIALNLVIYGMVWILLESRFSSKFNCKINAFSFSFKELTASIRSGFALMVGNFASIFLTSVDRWFVKYLLSSVAFAQYSFAVSMESFLNYAVSPFSVTFYNYFCKEKRNEKIKLVHHSMLIVAVLLVACAFPAKFILEVWLTAYMGSVDVLFYLFGAQVFFIIIKCVYVNLYKAQKKQNLYFKRLTTVLISGIIFNALFYLILRNKEAMAIGTLGSALLWFILSQIDFPEIRYDWKHLIFLAAEVFTFVLFGNHLNAVWGLLLYMAVTAILAMICIRPDIQALVKILKNRSNF